MNLKDRLEDAGLTVVMTRDSNDVNISNSERAIIANEVAADLFVRIHADGSPNPEVAGITTLYPGANTWTKGIAEESKRAADLVHAAVVGSTGAVSLGTVQRTDLTGFNWSEVPTVLVECGFMSNPVEDRLLASPHYQTKLATGMAVGILEYLGG
jgi:N-acetylmuramoyl-L-alanine amidase